MPDFYNPTLNGGELEPGAYAGCFACGPDNPKGLRMAFSIPEPGRAEIEWTPAGPEFGMMLYYYRGDHLSGMAKLTCDVALVKTGDGR